MARQCLSLDTRTRSIFHLNSWYSGHLVLEALEFIVTSTTQKPTALLSVEDGTGLVELLAIDVSRYLVASMKFYYWLSLGETAHPSHRDDAIERKLTPSQFSPVFSQNSYVPRSKYQGAMNLRLNVWYIAVP